MEDLGADSPSLHFSERLTHTTTSGYRVRVEPDRQAPITITPDFVADILSPYKAHARYLKTAEIASFREKASDDKGKGAPDHWVAVVRPGKILFEMEGVSVADAQEAMRLASHKLPLRTRFVKREGTH